MSGYETTPIASHVTLRRSKPVASRAIGPFRFGKRGFDIIGSLLLLPVLGLAAVVLAMINPVFNPGPLIFSQQRMG